MYVCQDLLKNIRRTHDRKISKQIISNYEHVYVWVYTSKKKIYGQ